MVLLYTMATLLKLANETLFQVIEDVQPEDILNFSLTCKFLSVLSEDALAQHAAKRKTYSEVTLYGCHRHEEALHPLTLITEICKDPKIASYPRSLKIECCDLFAGRRGDESQEYDEDGFTEEDDEDDAEQKKSDDAMAEAMTDKFERSIIRQMRVSNSLD